MELEMVYVKDTRRFHVYQPQPMMNPPFSGGIYIPKVSGKQPATKIKVTVEEVK